jgi:DNA-binding beta-propeller fold protein YncE
VAALENGSLEVIDLQRNRHVASLEGFRQPQGVAFLAADRKLFVTNGEGAGVTVLEGSDLTRSAWMKLRADPDNIRWEAAAKLLWVGAGGSGSGALAALDPESGEVVAEISLAGHPESFQLEARGSRVFVNVPKGHEVAVIDRELRRVVAGWRLPCTANFPMALDEARRRLFVGCRRPARLLVLDTDTGTPVAELESPADADDIFLDSPQNRVYVSGGEGVTRVYARREADRFEVVGDLRTGPGARTSLFVPELRRFYVAVPRRGDAPAEILVFETLQSP